jgi:hypothetical protein
MFYFHFIDKIQIKILFAKAQNVSLGGKRTAAPSWRLQQPEMKMGTTSEIRKELLISSQPSKF